MVYILQSNFGVLWYDGVDLGASNWFQMGISEALLMVIAGS